MKTLRADSLLPLHDGVVRDIGEQNVAAELVAIFGNPNRSLGPIKSATQDFRP